jgi:hypothetical protein
MVLQDAHASRELVLVDLTLSEAHLQDVRRGTVRRRRPRRTDDVGVVVGLRTVEVANDQIRERANEEKEQDHDDQPRYSEAHVGASVEEPTEGRTAARAEGSVRSDVYRFDELHATTFFDLHQNLPARDGAGGVGFVKNP